MIYNNLEVYANQTIQLVNIPNYINLVVCASVYSRPDVNLTLYDTNTRVTLSTYSNSNRTKTCLSSSNICTNILYVYLEIQKHSLNSISCSTQSLDPNVPLLAVISRNVTISSRFNLILFI